MPPDLWDNTLYWQAESLLELNKFPEAEQKFRALLALKDQTEHADAANLGLAWALFKQGREADATPIIQGLIKNNGGSSTGQQAQLLQAKILLGKKDFKDAIVSL
jgi:outer membrane protein assembly factor BamD (BamD/ComL family)